MSATITEAQAAQAARLLLEGAGAASDIALEVAQNLADAEACGHGSHGIRLVAPYVDRLLADKSLGQARPRVESRDGPITRIAGCNAFGQITGAFAARHGIETARKHGIAAVAVTGSGHFGRNGQWPELAAQAGIASLHFINAPGAPSSVVPPSGQAARLTSNPAAFGLPRRTGDPIIVDFATGDFSVNAIKQAQEQGEKLPRASILREDGTLSDDPAEFLRSSQRAMLPFGGFKGFGLAVVIELLAGALTGGGCHKGHAPADATNNMLSIYLDVSRFTPEDIYEREMEAFLDGLCRGKDVERLDVAPGTRSRQRREASRRDGLVIHPSLHRILRETAQRLSMEDELATILGP